MEKLRILVDWDDCLNDLVDQLLILYEKRFAEHIDKESITNFDLSESLPPEQSSKLYSLFIDEELWKSVKVQPGAAKAVQEMIADGHEVFIVTATDYRNVVWKMEWLQKNLPFFPIQNVIITSQKHLLAADYLIDDNLDNLRRGIYGRIVIDKPWNRDVREDIYDIKRATNLKEAYQIIKKQMEQND